MTDLLTRTSAARPSAAEPAGRPLTVSAAFAGLAAAGSGLVVCLAVAVLGWFLADGGAHGDTRDALRVGADAWLVGHGSHLTYGGVDYTVVPLGLTALLAWVCFRAGRWAGTTSTPGEDRELVVGTGLFASCYVVVAVVTSVVAATTEVGGSLVLTLLGGLVLAGGAGGCGLVTGAARWPAVRALLPAWAWPVVRSALATVLGCWTCSALVVAVAFALDLGSAATVVSRLGLHAGDVLMLVLLTALVTPNAVLLGGAYLLGPGFAVGTGTLVSPGAVQLGPVPAFPLLAALPDGGPTPWFSTALMALPVLVAAASVALVQRRHPVLAWDLALLRGAGAGVLAGLVTGVLTGLAGGALGSGRMADVGAPTGEVLVAAMLAMGLGGLVGSLLMTFVQRRRGMPEEPAAPDTRATPVAPVARPVGSPDAEDTVELDLGPR